MGSSGGGESGKDVDSLYLGGKSSAFEASDSSVGEYVAYGDVDVVVDASGHVGGAVG